MASRKFAIKDGHRLAVLRPRDPALALALTAEWKARGGGREGFNKILTEQPYTYCGLLAAGGKKILDPAGMVVGAIKIGDSFISESDLAKLKIERPA